MIQFIHKIRSFFANQYLVKIPPANTTTNEKFEFQKFKSIVLLFSITNLDEVALIKQFVKYIIDFKKEVTTVIYIQNAQLKIDFSTFPSSKNYILTQYDLDFNYKPKSKNLFNDLFSNKFDFIINADLTQHHFISYIFASLKANFKLASLSNFNSKHAQLLIDNHADISLKYFLKHTDHYLQLINKHE